MRRRCSRVPRKRGSATGMVRECFGWSRCRLPVLVTRSCFSISVGQVRISVDFFHW